MDLVNFAKYVKILLNYDENLIIIGRNNAEQSHFKKNYIVIDQLTAAQLMTQSQKYDKENDKEFLFSRYLVGVSIEFYGDDYLINHNRFVSLNSSHVASQIAIDNNIIVHSVTNSNRIPQQIGNKYYDRFECNLNISLHVKDEIALNSFDADTIKAQPTGLYKQN